MLTLDTQGISLTLSVGLVGDSGAHVRQQPQEFTEFEAINGQTDCICFW